MLINYYLIILILVLVITTLGILKSEYLLTDRKIRITTKVVSALIGVSWLLFFLWNTNYIDRIVGFNDPAFVTGGHFFYNNFPIILSGALFWLTLLAGAIVFLIPFFPQIKIARHLVKFLALPVFITSIIFFYQFGISIAGEVDPELFTQGIVRILTFESFSWRLTFMALFLGSSLGASLVWSFKFLKEKVTLTDLKNILLAIIPLLLVSMPLFLPRMVFGNGPSRSVLDFRSAHRLVLYFYFIIPIIVFIALYKKDIVVKRYAMTISSLLAMVVFLMENFTVIGIVYDPTHLPLHLCNTAMILLPMALIFNMKKLFYFSVFINVLGAFLAALLPNYNTIMPVFDPRLLVFHQNHAIAFFMPILCIALGLFPRPKLSYFIWSMVGFSAYFILVLIVNSWFTSMGYCVDYFFLNSDFIVAQLGQWARDTRNFTWYLEVGGNTWVFYPIYQALFFAVYVALGIGIWFLYEVSFKISDTFKETLKLKDTMRLKHKELVLALGGRLMSQPVLEEDDMLKIQNYTKRYGNSERLAVDDANLEVNEGEIFGFLGPNGAGKSTIIKSLVGINPLTSGKIYVNGFDIESQALQAKSTIGFVPDHYALYEHLSGREYVNYMADIYNVSKKDRTERIEKLIDTFEIKYAFDQQIKTYSHGMKQKIALLSALVHSPKLLILDEPLTGLDPNSIFQVKETMRAHARAGNIVFFSSHIIDVVEKLCDRIAIISKGKIVAVTSLAQLKLQNMSLESYYISFIGEKGAER